MTHHERPWTACIAIALVAGVASAAGNDWTTRVDDRTGDTTVMGDIVSFALGSEAGIIIVGGLTADDVLLFDLEMPTGEDFPPDPQLEFHGALVEVSHPPVPQHPPDPGLEFRVHDNAALAGRITCATDPPDPGLPSDPCMITFPEGSILEMQDDLSGFDVFFPSADGGPADELSWVGFNPQPEPPAEGGHEDAASIVGFNPQPDPPGEPWVTFDGGAAHFELT